MATVRLRLPVLLLSLVALCLPAALLPSPAAAVAPRTNPLAPFTAPVTVGAAVSQAWQQQVVADGLGVLEVWVGGTSAAQRVYSRRWLPSGGWGAPVALSAPMHGVVTSASSSGDAAVVGWTGTLVSGVTLAQASVRAYRLGPWSAARTLGTATGTISVSAMVSGVAATWLSPGPSGLAVEAATWALGPSGTTGSWTSTAVLQGSLSGLTTLSRNGISAPVVVEHAAGAVVAWRAHDDLTGDQVMAGTWDGAGGWTAPVQVSNGGESCRLEAMEPTPQGATVITSCLRAGMIALDARDWTFLGTPSWGSTITLDIGAMPEASRDAVWDLDAAWGGSGSSMVAVVWRHVGAPSAPGTVTVAVDLARRSPDGTWLPAVQMSPTGAVSGGPSVGITGGVALVGWYRMIGTTYGIELRAARQASLTGSFRATEGVPARYVDALRVSGTPNGAVVAWQRRPARNSGGVIEGVSYNDTTGWGRRTTLGSGYALAAVASRTSTGDHVAARHDGGGVDGLAARPDTEGRARDHPHGSNAGVHPAALQPGALLARRRVVRRRRLHPERDARRVRGAGQPAGPHVPLPDRGRNDGLPDRHRLVGARARACLSCRPARRERDCLQAGGHVVQAHHGSPARGNPSCAVATRLRQRWDRPAMEIDR